MDIYLKGFCLFMSNKSVFVPCLNPSICKVKTHIKGSKSEIDCCKQSIGLIKKKKDKFSFAPIKKDSILIDEIFKVEELEKMIEGGFVKSVSHPDDENLCVLSYTQKTQFSGKWNDVTKFSRGLIVRKKTPTSFKGAEIVERPWAKFFTLQQIGDKNGWALGDEECENNSSFSVDDIDFEAEAEVLDKCDGSMGVLFKAPDGKLAFSTKGSFSSEQALHYTNLLRSNKEFYEKASFLKNENPDTTFIFELVGPENQIVLYHEKDDIVLLGAVQKDGQYLLLSDFEDSGFNTAEKMPAKNLREALELPNREEKEGVVIHIKGDVSSQKMLKMKQEDYLALHRVMTNISPKAVKNIISEAKTNYQELKEVLDNKDINRIFEIKDFLEKVEKKPMIHEKYKKQIEDAFYEVVGEMIEAEKLVDSVPELHNKEGKKDFAKMVKDKKNKSLYFSSIDNRIQGKQSKELKVDHVLKLISHKII